MSLTKVIWSIYCPGGACLSRFDYLLFFNNQNARVPSSLPGQHGVHRDTRPRNQHAALQLDQGQGTQGDGHQRPLRLVLQGATFACH